MWILLSAAVDQEAEDWAPINLCANIGYGYSHSERVESLEWGKMYPAPTGCLIHMTEHSDFVDVKGNVDRIISCLKRGPISSFPCGESKRRKEISRMESNVSPKPVWWRLIVVTFAQSAKKEDSYR